ncbi:BnaC04g52370D [Brassica napus]|uniref:(rape) hypothetical protein n=1 Tax=Brassica napus TaxID=3708 RepID=A0A078JCI0_BRANA|nr:unnamed protein product [Brassica napus]CDY62330.1 BnaC04g52370D [Brassica napus]
MVLDYEILAYGFPDICFWLGLAYLWVCEGLLRKSTNSWPTKSFPLSDVIKLRHRSSSEASCRQRRPFSMVFSYVSGVTHLFLPSISPYLRQSSIENSGRAQPPLFLDNYFFR